MSTWFVISDLHLGGSYPEGASSGFRMMTRPEALAEFIRQVADQPDARLVINGDFVDFLAEEHPEPGPHWRAFLGDPPLAIATLDRIVRRDAVVFDALKRLGGRLHILLGNHDVELSLPGVRERLDAAVGGAHFLYDGEALVVGDAIIEHGNRVDDSNQVDHAALLATRTALSRGDEPESRFVVPFGSRFVTQVMNPIKRQWPFIDLLKPEGPALVALLLALDPSQKSRVLDVIRVATGRRVRGPGDDGADRGPALSDDQQLDALLSGLLDAPESLATTPPARRTREPMSLAAFVSLSALLALNVPFERRLRYARPAIERLRHDTSFDARHENEARYWKAARELVLPTTRRAGFRHVVFGHTHMAREVPILDGETRLGTYYNSGTWANLMRFPKRLFSADKEEADEAFVSFAAALKRRDLDDLIEFHPTYVRLDLGDDGRAHGAMRAFDGSLT